MAENNYKYHNDDRVISMSELEEILTDTYGNSEYDRQAGCYSNHNWFSVDAVLSLANDIACEID